MKDNKEITIIDGGPAIIEGPVSIITKDGEHFSEKRVAICRCGRTKKGYFCDGSHAKKEDNASS